MVKSISFPTSCSFIRLIIGENYPNVLISSSGKTLTVTYFVGGKIQAEKFYLALENLDMVPEGYETLVKNNIENSDISSLKQDVFKYKLPFEVNTNNYSKKAFKDWMVVQCQGKIPKDPNEIDYVVEENISDLIQSTHKIFDNSFN